MSLTARFLRILLSGLLASVLVACSDAPQGEASETGNSETRPSETSLESLVQETASTSDTPDSSRTIVYVNADLVTMNEEQPRATAIAVRDGLILAVGNRADVEAAAGYNADVRDLEGKTMLPGLIDAHGHISFTSLTVASANVSSPPVGPVETINQLVAALKTHVAQVPADGWIVGWGYDDSLLAEQRHPTREDLDQVSAERPVAIRHVSGHFMSCNSICLEMAGVSAETSDPKGGIIRRLSGGTEPDGVLEETAMGKLFAVLPRPDKDLRLKLLQKTQQYYASYGITTVQDGAAQAAEIDLLREAADNGMLYLDTVAYPYALYLGDKLADYPPDPEYSGHFRVGGFKLVLDGSPQGKTAWLTEPYLHPPHGQVEGYSGYATLEDQQVADFIDLAFSRNIPVLAHANGDAAADQLIAAVTAGNQAHGNADRRTVMIHAQTARDDQIDAMIAQNIMPSYFSAHTFYWGDWHRDSVFGEKRALRISPLRTSADRGLIYTTHNDTPIVPPDMMRLLWASVNRITRSGQVLGADQQATVMEALKSITINAAYQYFEEDRKGTLEPGKLADMVILDQNPLDVDPLNLKDIQVLETIKDGKTVFSR